MAWTIPNDRKEFVHIESIDRYLKKAKTPSSYDNWKYSLYDFFEFVGIHPDDFVKLDRGTLEDLIEHYVDHLKERVSKKDLNPNSIENLVLPLKKYLILNRVEGMSEAWVRIKENFPHKIRSSDQKYTEIELQKMYNIADIREKSTLGLLMTGMRIGAAPAITVKDMKPVDEWAIVTVYSGTTSEYNAFLTPQGFQDINNYLDYRQRNGEIINGDSPVIRDKFQPECAGQWTDKHGIQRGCSKPIKTGAGAASIIVGLSRRAGISTNSHNHKTRNKIMICHGIRKYVNTVLKTSGMDSERVELLLGHSNSSLAGHYWRLPSDESEILFPLRPSRVEKDYIDRIEAMMREPVKRGRKHKYGIVPITHLPSDISPGIVNLCNTKIAFRCSGARSWIRENFGKDLVSEIEQLPTGHCRINTEKTSVQMNVKIEIPLVDKP